VKDLFSSYFDDMSVLPQAVDGLFVVNQEAAPSRVANLVREFRVRSLVIVSSHAPFPDEFASFRLAMKTVRLWWIPMSFLLTDAEMEGCDDQAVAELAGDGRRLDVGCFLIRSRYLRNELACQNLSGRVKWQWCFASNGIGIVREAWRDAAPLERQGDHAQPARSARLLRLVGRFFQRRNPIQIEIVEDGYECYIFIGGSTHRLRFREGVNCHTWVSSLGGFSFQSDIEVLCRLVEIATSRFRIRETRVATTVHHFSPWMLDRFPDLRVFVDGLHPPNYPIAYGASYRGVTIVSREHCDRKWFEKCGCSVLPPAHVLAPERSYRNAANCRPFRNICLVLNHAGDWSALIDRSDTDLVVMEFVAAAQDLPELRFRVRAHPTMAIAEHEGSHSLDRLRRWVIGQGLENLQFSTASLDQDMAWAECCVSEYSNILVDCMKSGKMCLALNPTNRRSFLEHLEPEGLRTVSNGQGLAKLLRSCNI